MNRIANYSEKCRLEVFQFLKKRYFTDMKFKTIEGLFNSSCSRKVDKPMKKTLFILAPSRAPNVVICEVG